MRGIVFILERVMAGVIDSQLERFPHFCDFEFENRELVKELVGKYEKHFYAAR